MSISIVTLISRAIDLRYPLDAVLESVAPIADEIIVNVDLSRDDGTYAYVLGLQGKQYKNLSIVGRRWNWNNRQAGSELTIQSNLAIEQAKSDWILYIQADEILHEDDHKYLVWLAATLPAQFVGIEFMRLYFWRDLATLRRDWTVKMTRMFRRGGGRTAGDAMFCEVAGQVWPVMDERIPGIWHYSRIGDPALVGTRIANLDTLFHSREDVEPGVYDFRLRSYDSFAKDTKKEDRPDSVLEQFDGTHPAAYRKWLAKTLVSVVPPGHPEYPKLYEAK